MKYIFALFTGILTFSMHSQIQNTDLVVTEIRIDNDTIVLSKVSISPFHFSLTDASDKEINTTLYTIDFPNATLFFNDDSFFNKTLKVTYEKLPEYLTKTYQTYDSNLIVENSVIESEVQPVEFNIKKNKKPFKGLDTNGNISRGITMGNNQDGVLNSNFDLQLSGKLSSKVTLKANITDNHIPLTDNGYTQRLNEFDRVFIEMYSDKWRVKAGDIYFDESDNYYSNFKKKVSGIAIEADLGKATKVSVSSALVKGKYTEFDFNGIDANQGPYRIASVDKPTLLIIAQSETVFINGKALKRGKDNDYVIDYNAAEITFNTTFPINANMRIRVEFQAGDENYTRFVTHNKANYKNDDWEINVGFYNENDVKNQALQQDLSDEHKLLLANAGDDDTNMFAISAIAEGYEVNKIQYKKELINAVETFVFSTNATDELYAVRFGFVGENNGDYIVSNIIATGRVYEYVAPINNIKQGDYTPKIKLVAPGKLQLTTFNASFKPSEKTHVQSQFAFSNADKNLFSNLEDSDNLGIAGHINWQQVLIDKEWKLKSSLFIEQIEQKYETIENVQHIEFDRDWNLINPTGNHQLIKTGLSYSNDTKGFIDYQYQQLNFDNYTGFKHYLLSDLNFKNIRFLSNASVLSSTSEIEQSDYAVLNASAKKEFKQFWLGAKLDFENNIRKDKLTQHLTNFSHKNTNYSAIFGVGDSLKRHLEIGYSFRQNDSLQNTNLQRVNYSNNYYLKSKLIQKKNADLSVYVNYRQQDNRLFSNDESVNSKLQYRQHLWQNLVTFGTNYETSSGVLPQQEYNYLEVDTGSGYYTWIDFNDDGIQDLNEFEIAQFPDQATYVRIVLPTTRFIRTNKNVFHQQFNINPSQLQTGKGEKKWWTHFVNQASVHIESKHLKNATIHLNPFDFNEALSVQYNLKNGLFFNRAKQHYSTTYTYNKTQNKSVYITGLQDLNLILNQLDFTHKLSSQWLLNLRGSQSNSTNENERYSNRNYDIGSNEFYGKISYLDRKTSKLDAFFKYKEKENVILNKEHLISKTVGVAYRYSKNEKMSLRSSVNFIYNTFNGNEFSPVGFQMLEGLQNGNNFTWDLILQRKLLSYLDINLNYNARKSPDFKAIHTGTVQVRANF
ncbi:MAG: hypothetical protein V3U80_06025 [Flavobacteriaceae bacterium]